MWRFLNSLTAIISSAKVSAIFFAYSLKTNIVDDRETNNWTNEKCRTNDACGCWWERARARTREWIYWIKLCMRWSHSALFVFVNVFHLVFLGWLFGLTGSATIIRLLVRKITETNQTKIKSVLPFEERTNEMKMSLLWDFGCFFNANLFRRSVEFVKCSVQKILLHTQYTRSFVPLCAHFGMTTKWSSTIHRYDDFKSNAVHFMLLLILCCCARPQTRLAMVTRALATHNTNENSFVVRLSCEYRWIT